MTTITCDSVLSSTSSSKKQVRAAAHDRSQLSRTTSPLQSHLHFRAKSAAYIVNLTQYPSFHQIQPPEPPRWHSVVVNTLQVEQRVHSPSESTTLSV
jgi:hypothetical protein